jgi:hypothetical protein
MAGFITGEGCFYVKIRKSSSHSIGYQVMLEFSVGQHIRDTQLLANFITYLGCGKLYTNPNLPWATYRCHKFAEIDLKILPYFYKNKIKGVKSEDFNAFCEIAEIIRDKAHLTSEGLDKIKEIKSGMNTGRYAVSGGSED